LGVGLVVILLDINFLALSGGKKTLEKKTLISI
jgi:hypothetical protein